MRNLQGEVSEEGNHITNGIRDLLRENIRRKYADSYIREDRN